MDPKETEGEVPEVKEPLTDKPKQEQPEKKVETTLNPEQFQEQQVELEKTRKALKEANKEAAERRKRLEELEKAEADRKAAEMTEAEKQQARIKELEEKAQQYELKLKESERRELQRRIAKEAGLPEGLAERLRGETEEEMAADAKTVLELLPKQEAKVDEKTKPPKLPVTNPADGKKGETRAQKAERLGLGQRVNVWDGDLTKKQGGGVEISGE